MVSLRRKVKRKISLAKGAIRRATRTPNTEWKWSVPMSKKKAESLRRFAKKSFDFKKVSVKKVGSEYEVRVVGSGKYIG